ncbi:MAG: hypothetical protein HY905_14260 [Deltaproteobacteria bacterium]|nr:hypothetical protein [Deltaproteobacteria bacterium]
MSLDSRVARSNVFCHTPIVRNRSRALRGFSFLLATGFFGGCTSGIGLWGDFVQQDVETDAHATDGWPTDGPDDMGDETAVEDALTGDLTAEDGAGDALRTCPREVPNWIAWQLDGSTELIADLDLPCVLEDVLGDSSDHLELTFNCDAGSAVETHILDVFSVSLPRLGFLAGQRVQLRYVGSRGTWMKRWVRVVDGSGSLMVAAVTADSLAPPAADPVEWYSPLRISMVSGVCALRPSECGPWEHQPLRVCVGTTCLDVVDGDSDVLRGDRVVFVFPQSVAVLHDRTCADAPASSFDAVLLVFALS